MKKEVLVILVACFSASAFLGAKPSALRAEDVFITIGGGDLSGVYFPAGLAMAKIINSRRYDHGVRATVEATPASVFNLNAIAAGYLEFGLAQADKQYQAVSGLAEWAKKGPQEELRAVFSIHNESVTLVAAADAGIDTIMDLKGKRVNLGNPGSGQHRNAIDALEAVGIDPKRDILPQQVNAAEAPTLLEDNLIDAFFFTAGHPSRTMQEAISGRRKVKIIPIPGPAVDKLIADNKYYSKSAIPVKRLYPELGGPKEVATFGVLATLCTSSRVPAEVVYILTREVFENLDEFRRQHPAFADLTREGMLQGLSAPIHPGAVKYYKEVGLMR